MEYLLTSSPILGMLLWITLYISDYYMTLSSAKGYKEMSVMRFENSFELNPAFQKDIDSQTKVSSRHVTFLILYTAAILFLWFVAVRMFNAAWAYSFFIGMLVLMEVTIHMRHFRNWYFLRVFRSKGGITGGITYAQWFSYQVSAFEFYCFAALYLLFFLLTYSFFFLGGVMICLRIGVSHSNLAKKVERQHSASVAKNENSSS